MLEKLFEDGEKFELKGVEFTVLSVGNHEPGGFSYAFRPTSDIEKDEQIIKEKEEAHLAELAKEQEASAEELNASVEEELTESEGDE